MVHKVDFEEIKALVSITDVASWLGIKLKATGNTFRGDCPLCGEERSFTLTPQKGLFGCFKCQVRGSVLDMVHHVKQTANVRDAALLIQQQFLGRDSTTVPAPAGHSSPSITNRPPPQREEKATVPQNERPEPTGPTSSGELKPLEYLATDHAAIEALGLSVAACNALGIGFAPKGTMRGRVVFPLRTKEGKLCGYAGLATNGEMAPLMMLPKNLDQMVAAPVEQEKPVQVADDVRQFLRVVK